MNLIYENNNKLEYEIYQNNKKTFEVILGCDDDYKYHTYCGLFSRINELLHSSKKSKISLYYECYSQEDTFLIIMDNIYLEWVNYELVIIGEYGNNKPKFLIDLQELDQLKLHIEYSSDSDFEIKIKDKLQVLSLTTNLIDLHSIST